MRLSEEQYAALLVKRKQLTAIAKRMLIDVATGKPTLPSTHGSPSTKSTKSARPKYGNRKVTDAEGRVHDSTKEYRRWQELELRARAGDIRSLRRQVPYALVHNGVLIARYIADFVYEDGAQTVCEDVKSPPTRKLEAYRMKVRLMAACHGIQVREV